MVCIYVVFGLFFNSLFFLFLNLEVKLGALGMTKDALIKNVEYLFLYFVLFCECIRCKISGLCSLYRCTKIFGPGNFLSVF